MKEATDESLAMQLMGYRLTTAEIVYHLPDHPRLLQEFIWQALDIAPKFPVLHQFLDFWNREIEGKLHSVRVGAAQLITPGEIRANVTLISSPSTSGLTGVKPRRLYLQ